MAYKAVADRVRVTEDEFAMGTTVERLQRNGVVSTLTRATRDDGLSTREILIFANGGRVDRIRAAIAEGSVSRLRGKYSQTNVFVALDVA